jgi:hypothetical protein
MYEINMLKHKIHILKHKNTFNKSIKKLNNIGKFKKK